MTIKDVLLKIIKGIGIKEFEEELGKCDTIIDTPNISYIFFTFEEELKNVSRENSYIKEREVNTVNKRICYAFMPTEVFEIVSVKLNDKEVKYAKGDMFVELKDDGKYTVEYKTYPTPTSMQVNADYEDSVKDLINDAILSTVAKLNENKFGRFEYGYEQ